MPRPTPFFPRTSALCQSMLYKHWSGWFAVCHYDESPEREYNAIRQGAGLIDVTPLYKYEVRGKGAGRLLDYVMARPVSRLKRGRVTYLCWCDDEGKVLDDGTCWRLDKRAWRITSASPSWFWFARHAERFEGVEVTDVTEDLAAVALQGPTSRRILADCCDADLEKLRFFGWTHTTFEGPTPFSGTISRTGYTGDLGYEVWVAPDHALALWDLLMDRGKGHGIWPMGLDALDISRIEAGFVLQGCDYYSAFDTAHPASKSSPFEINLGWTVDLDRDPFIGQQALVDEQRRGSRWGFVGLVIDWEALEAAFERHDLPPAIPTAAWRKRVPLYRGMRQVGYASSGTWSPTLKKNLALASVFSEVQAPGTELDIELLVDWERTRIPCVVTELPFFDPPRKRL